MMRPRSCWTTVSGVLLTIAFAVLCQSTEAQEFQQFLADGEFSAAMEVAGDDQTALAEIARSQMAIGESGAAFHTAGSIRDEQTRGDTLIDLQKQNGLLFQVLGGSSGGTGSDRGTFGGGITGTTQNGGGGITAADFTTLMNLIQNTIASDSWEANGGGNGTMSPYPSGVYVNADGVLNRIPKTKLTFASLADFDEGRNSSSVSKTSIMRKVSLTRLERAVQLRAARGQAPTEEMLFLAGLTDIRYVMVDPDNGEVIIAGPAGAWKRQPDGKVISTVDQQPVLLLDDFVVCLRNAKSNEGKFGCAIVPRKENLAATKRYVSTTRGSGKKWQKGLREALGLQDIEVFGIPSSSHAARVLVEADYHMKLLGMGIEPSIPAVPSYLKRVKLDANGNPPPMDVVRWWFALNYEKLISNEQQTLFEFTGPGVKVLAETELINDQGERIHTGKAIGPTRTFARDFTEHFEDLATLYPIYNELKNVFDLAIVANLMHEFRLTRKANWNVSYFDQSGDAAERNFQISSYRPASTVQSVINRHVLKDRRNGETTIHTLIGVSGGVSFDPSSFVNAGNVVIENDVEFTEQLDKATKHFQGVEIWWWD